jgi:hypothetical protein
VKCRCLPRVAHCCPCTTETCLCRPCTRHCGLPPRRMLRL